MTGSESVTAGVAVPIATSREVGDAFGLLDVSPEFHCSDPSTGVLGKGQRSKGRPGRRESVAREWVDPMGAR